TSCNDANPCTSGDTCGNGSCAGTLIAGCTTGSTGCTADSDCNDSLSCTADSCVAGTCTFQLDATACLVSGICFNTGQYNPSDSCLVCDTTASQVTWTSVSDGAQCGDGTYACSTVADCPDDVCQTSSCIDSKCNYTTSVSGTACSDGNACTLNDTCDNAGACIGTSAPVCNTSGTCTTTVDCNDNNACTTDLCEGGLCIFVGSSTSDGLTCSDGDSCTDSDTCVQGVCTGTPSPACQTGGACTSDVGCDDGLSCTDDTCTGGTCTFKLNDGCLINGACVAEDDYNSADACAQCQPNQSLTEWTLLTAGTQCGDGSIACPNFGPCVAGVCQIASCTTSGCQYGPSAGGESCDDGNACTTSEVCSGGACLGQPIDGCFTGANCTTDSNCNDSNACTSNQCINGTCTTNVTAGCLIANQCVADGATSGAGCLSCAPSTSKLTWTAAPNGTVCDDGDACTPTEACSNGTCIGTSTTCNDGLACTTDACDGQGGCNFDLNPGFCVIGGTCISAGSVSPSNACLVCDPTQDTNNWSALTASCDDGDNCTFNDTCTTSGCAGTPYSCDDGLSCTSESCNGAGGCTTTLLSGCLIGGDCYADGDVNPSNPCQQCVTTSATDSWISLPDNTPCNDGSVCTTGDTCINGACQTTASCTASGFCSDCNSCACSSGTYGPDCAEICPGGADTPCSNQGQCEGDGTCTCFDGFTGNDCSVMCSISGGAGSVDSDGDGVCDNDDPADNDGDGVLDASDNCTSGWNSADADSDGTPDACDTTPGGGTVVNISQFNLCDSGSLTTTCVVSTSKSFNNQNLRISGPGSLTINNGATVSCSSSLCSLGIDMAQNVNVNGTIQAASVAVQGANIVVSGTVTTSGRGYSANNGPGAGSHCSTNIGASGAGHGGYGGGCNGNISGGNKGLPYGNVKRSFEFGSGGGTQSAYGQPGGMGGGRIHLTATSQMTINGTLSSAGNSGSGSSSSYGAGGGSGGSILIETPSLSGTGSLNAQGGNGAIINGGGGAGGRISVLATNYGGDLSFSTGPGCSGASTGCSSSRAGAGTVYFQDSGTLIYDGNNGSASTKSPHIPGTYNHIEIREGANVEGTYPLNATQSLVLAGASTLTAGAKPLMTSAPDTTIEGTISGNAVTVISANTLSLGASGTAACDSFDCTIGMYAQQQIHIAGAVRASTIDLRGNSANISGQVSAAGRGYAANNGPGAKVGCGTNIGAGGGSHAGAGLGCNAGLTDGSDVYGLPTRPWTYGSGGTTQSAYGQSGGAGGGRVRLSVEGVLKLTGSIDVQGTNGAGNSSSYGAGGGAGGSVQVFAAEVTGTGLITADGGNGAIINGGGGGGGRIAVYAQPSLPITTYARGGCGGASSGCSSTHAGAGTIYNGGSCTITVSNKGSGTSNPTPIAETVTVANLIVSSHGRAQIADALELQSSLTVDANSLFSTTGANTVVNAPTTTVSGTISASENLQLNASNVTIAAGGNMKCSSNLCTLDVNSSGSWNVLGTVEGSFIDVSSASTSISGSITSEGRGYGPQQGPGSGQHCGTNIGASGASYGGRGGECNSGTSGVKDHYGSIVEPADFGSGGGTQSAYGMTGGAGGGRIRLTSSGAMNITGSLSSAGKNGTGNSSSYGAGGGSG
ncbi:MAG: hypothetical protein VX223_17765, partial [Myxococcota bacterium]|nr:hypothetical protein [Myxococcota bacterium]